MDQDTLYLLDSAYKLIITSYAAFYLVFIVTEACIRLTRRCYKPFAWNVIILFVNICFLSMFLFQIYLSIFTESMISFLYVVLIAYCVRSLINELLDRYLPKQTT